jgi:hypothetical protein
MHGPSPHHNPLAAAAHEVWVVARETTSPWFVRAALVIMAASAAVTTAIGALQVRHMLRRELREEQKEREREQRAHAAAPPPERPGEGSTVTAGMPAYGRDDGEGRWARREELAAQAGRGHGR